MSITVIVQPDGTVERVNEGTLQADVAAQELLRREAALAAQARQRQRDEAAARRRREIREARKAKAAMQAQQA
jgi:hypothetical protein